MSRLDPEEGVTWLARPLLVYAARANRCVRADSRLSKDPEEELGSRWAFLG